MRPTDFIRQLLDMIDEIEAAQTPNIEIEIDAEEPSCGCDAEYANEPDEHYSDVSAVTTLAGGGVNGPKNPADIRGEHPSMYPNSQWKV